MKRGAWSAIGGNDMELRHHGVKGQRWGVRRYQNKDGTLTAAGKKHYSESEQDDIYKTMASAKNGGGLFTSKKKLQAKQDEMVKRNITDTLKKSAKAYQKAEDKYIKGLDEEFSPKNRNLESDYKMARDKYYNSAVSEARKMLGRYADTPYKSSGASNKVVTYAEALANQLSDRALKELYPRSRLVD